MKLSAWFGWLGFVVLLGFFQMRQESSLLKRKYMWMQTQDASLY